MKVSLSWLKEYVPISMDCKCLANELTMRGLEVESVIDRFSYLENVIVGRIDHLEIHPNSGDLVFCSIDCGDKPVTIVSSVKTLSVGMFVAVALPGTVMPNGKIIHEKKIKQHVSSGILCSEYDLGIGTNNTSIMEIGNNKFEIGQSVKNVLSLSDLVLEINVTPNRPDCCSMIGVAREVAAIQGVKFTPTNSKSTHLEVNTNCNSFRNKLMSVSVDVSNDICSQYLVRLFDNIKVESSPLWLKKCLISSGLNPINNIVDIINFVILETGQPLHAFDFSSLSNGSIIVKTSEAGDLLRTLDYKEVILSKDILAIYDTNGPVAVAGVIGGFDSRVTEETNKIALECAYFNPTYVRKASKKLCTSTESSYRFERGVDPKGLIKALERATMMIVDIASGNIVDNYIYKNVKIKELDIIIELSVGDTNRVLGTTLSLNQITSFLSSVGFFVEPNKCRKKVQVTVPSFRIDVRRKEDLIEEIARLYGYDNIPITFPKLNLLEVKVDKIEEQIKTVKSVLNGIGFSEVINYSFTNLDSSDQLRFKSSDYRKNYVKIINPISSSQSIMRSSLLPPFLNTVHRNISRQVKKLMLFEIGNTFISNGNNELPIETEMLLALCTGPRIESSWFNKEKHYDFFDIKGNLEELLAFLRIEDVYFTKINASSACYMLKDNFAKIVSPVHGDLGVVGEIDPNILNFYSIKQKVFIFEVNIEHLFKCVPESKFIKSIPLFPAVFRDATVIVNEEIESARLLEEIQYVEEKLIESIYLLNIFRGPSIQTGMKSISFRIVYRSSNMTLNDETVNTIHKKLITQLVNNFNAILPQ